MGIIIFDPKDHLCYWPGANGSSRGGGSSSSDGSSASGGSSSGHDIGGIGGTSGTSPGGDLSARKSGYVGGYMRAITHASYHADSRAAFTLLALCCIDYSDPDRRCR